MHPELISMSDDQLKLIVRLQTPGAGLRYVHVTWIPSKSSQLAQSTGV
jgi:hypothetical protein